MPSAAKTVGILPLLALVLPMVAARPPLPAPGESVTNFVAGLSHINGAPTIVTRSPPRLDPVTAGLRAQAQAAQRESQTRMANFLEREAYMLHHFGPHWRLLAPAQPTVPSRGLRIQANRIDTVTLEHLRPDGSRQMLRFPGVVADMHRIVDEARTRAAGRPLEEEQAVEAAHSAQNGAATTEPLLGHAPGMQALQQTHNVPESSQTASRRPRPA